MSIGPSSKAQKETPITSMKLVAGSVFSSFKKDPAGILFYLGMALLLVGSPFGLSFPSMFYGALFVLGTISAIRWVDESKELKKNSHAK